MRTNSKSRPHLLLLLGLALAGFSGPAQASLNIVGYANVTVTNGYNFLANPFDVDGTNSITNVIPIAPDGSMVFLWDTTNQVFTGPTFYSVGYGWSDNYLLPPGRGFVLWANTSTNYTNTFTGNVEQGLLTNFIAGTNKFTLTASKVPTTGNLTGTVPTNLGFPFIDGGNVYLFSAPRQTYLDAFTCFTGFGWFDPKGVVGTNGPVIAVGQSFFAQNPGPDTNWVVNFMPPSSPPPPPPSSPQTLAAASASSGPSIQHLAIGSLKVTLQISNPGGTSYNIQFSPDGATWQTVARNLTSGQWTEPYRAGRQGYYQVVKP
jgi:hypothetical protein